MESSGQKNLGKSIAGNYQQNLLIGAVLKQNDGKSNKDIDIENDSLCTENLLLKSKDKGMSEIEKIYQSGATIDDRDDVGSKFLKDNKKVVTVENSRNYPACNTGNVIKTFAAYVTFLGGGMGNSIFGATILQLEQQTNSTTQQIAPIFLWRALGSFAGNMAMAFLFDIIPPEIVLIVGCTVLGAMNLTIPWCTSFTMLMAMTVIHGLAHGSLGGGCNSYVVKTWRLKSAPFIQGLHFITSFGSMITPLVVDIFVHDIEPHSQIEVINNTSTASQEKVDEIYQNDNISQFRNQSIGTDEISSQIFVPFLVAALVVFAGAISFSWSLCMDVIHHKKSINRVDSFIESQKEVKLPLKNKPVFVMMLAFLCIYGGIEYTYGSWILAFVVKHLEQSFDVGALICTCYWGSLAAGRALGIITTKFFKPETLISISLIISTISLLVLTFGCEMHISVTWTCSILVGLSFSSIFGNCIAFCQRELNLSGKITSVLSMCLYVGFMSMPAIVGILFANYSPMFFPYILTASSVTITVMFAVILLYIKCCSSEKV